MSAQPRCSVLTLPLGLMAVMIGTLASGPVIAGVIRHDDLDGDPANDPDDYLYTNLAAEPEYAAVGLLLNTGDLSGSGTLVASRWVLTAAHLIDGTDYAGGGITGSTFLVGGMFYNANEWIPHPDWNGQNGYDIGIVHLNDLVSSTAPANRYGGFSELGSTATIVGFGLFGTGITGEQGGTFGTKRAGNNLIDAISGNYLMVDFDNPDSETDSSYGSSTPLQLEYSDAKGDSGGGVFIGTGSASTLAGVVSFGQSGPVGDPDGNPDADYGDISGYTRVSLFNGWIDDQLSARYWDGNSADNQFSGNSNWQDGAAPGAGNISVFNLNDDVTVDFANDISNKRSRVRSGNVTFDLGEKTYTLTGGSTLESSLIVAKSWTSNLADNATLSIENGVVNAVDASIAEQDGTNGTVYLRAAEGDGVAGTLEMSEDLSIGVSPTIPDSGGTGKVEVEFGAKLKVDGEIKIGPNSMLVAKNGAMMDLQDIVLRGGTYESEPIVTVANSNSIVGEGTVDGRIYVLAGGSIMATGDLTLGDADSNSGFLSEGELQIDSHTVTIRDGDAALLGSSTTLTGGTLIAENALQGVSIGTGETISGYGAIEGSVNVGTGGSITATGDLTMGNTNPGGGFFRSDGELHIGAHAVTLEVGWEATPGTVTTIEGGLLNVATGSGSGVGQLRLRAGDELRGGGRVNAFINVEREGIITATDDFELGNDIYNLGFQCLGRLNVGEHTVILHDEDEARGGQTTIEGGIIVADNGFRLGDGDSLTGFGTVQGRILAQSGSTITANGNLDLGDSTVSNGFVSEGELHVDSHTVTLHDADLAMLGLVTTINGGTLDVPNGFSIGKTNEQSEMLTGDGTVRGRVFVGDGGIVEFDGLLDGWVEVLDGGQMDLSGEIGAHVSVEPGGTITATGNLVMGNPDVNFGFVNHGTLNVGNHMVTLRDSTRAHVGQMTIGGGNVAAQNGFLLDPDHQVIGYGTLEGDVLSSGTFSPGDLVGQLTVEGDYRQIADGELTFQNGQLQIDIGGMIPATEHDFLDITGTAFLGGELLVAFADLGDGTFLPQLGNEFTILSAAGGLVGTFVIETLPFLPRDLTWNVLYGANDVVLQVATSIISGDYNGNGVVDAADYTVWRDTLGSTTDLRANGDDTGASMGVVDQADYVAWKSNFGASVAATFSASELISVPEPVGLVELATLVAIVLTARCQRVGVGLALRR